MEEINKKRKEKKEKEKKKRGRRKEEKEEVEEEKGEEEEADGKKEEGNEVIVVPTIEGLEHISASAQVLHNFAPIIDAFQELNQEKQNLIQENNFIKELNILLTEKIIYLVSIIKQYIEKDGSDVESV
jgi:uncharacterized membrane protein YdbT with pleckstrin-like domain